MSALYVVQTNAVPGREEEFDRWYDGQHLGDVLALDGFARARRYVLSATQPDERAAAYPYRSLALYEFAGHPAAGLAELGRAVADGMYLSPALERHKSTVVFEPVTVLRTS